MANLYIQDGSLPMHLFYKAVGRVAVDKLEAVKQGGKSGFICIAMSVEELTKLLDLAKEEKLKTEKESFTAQIKDTRIVVDIDLAILGKE